MIIKTLRGYKMPKMMKLYKLNMEKARGLNIGHFNPTCKAILKAMYRIEKMNTDHGHSGTTGEDILRFAVKTGLWVTRQAPEKYHTTWAYYVKLLKEKGGVYECGTEAGMSTEEYLDQEDDEPEDFGMQTMEEIMDNPEEEEFSDEDRKVSHDMDNMKANREDYDNEQTEAAE
jgi:hypothetical protein